jgi:hypothetical protein
MLGATVIVMEPGIGRILPMPLLGGFAPWAELSVQLGVLAILARHDRKVLGRVHPARGGAPPRWSRSTWRSWRWRASRRSSAGRRVLRRAGTPPKSPRGPGAFPPGREGNPRR